MQRVHACCQDTELYIYFQGEHNQMGSSLKNVVLISSYSYIRPPMLGDLPKVSINLKVILLAP